MRSMAGIAAMKPSTWHVPIIMERLRCLVLNAILRGDIYNLEAAYKKCPAYWTRVTTCRDTTKANTPLVYKSAPKNFSLC
jgi:hypothetical protein